MPTVQRFSTIDKAILVTTGNSLVICGSTTEPAVNTSELIQPDGTTTRDWRKSGSIASLEILDNSTILYAELVWYSTVFSNVSGATDLRSVQDNAITFTTPKGTYQIKPKFTDSNTSASGTVDRFRSADVTSYVQDALSGSYTVSNVPISVPSSGLSNSRAGWSLTVIYRNNSFNPKKIIYNSGIAVATPSTPLQAVVAGFTTSSDESVLKGNVTLVCANGGPLNGQEAVYVGPSFAQLSNIGNSVYSPNPNPGTAPNNPGNSFFSGVINVANPLSDSDGLLNINGTNGSNNNDGFVPTQTVGARNKFDITDVNISNTLVTNQTLLAGQIITGEAGDGIQLVSLGTQVLAKAPNIIATLTSYDIDGDSEYNVEVEEALVYAIQIKNDGDVDANNVIISAVLDSSTSFVSGSVTINGVTNSNANIANGINLGTISAKGIITVLFTVISNSVPKGGLISQSVNYNYQFISGIDTITNYGETNAIQLTVQEGNLSISKSASKSNMYVGDTVTYTVDIKNTGTEAAKDLFFQEKMDLSCSFVEGTVTINGKAYSDYDPISGFSLADLSVGSSSKIIFQSKLNSLPASTKVNNMSCISFGYIFNQYGYLYKKTIFSNDTSVQVLYTDVIGERCNNNNYPAVGNIVTYKLSLTNIGNIDATNVQVLEPSIAGASFVSGSVKINGTVKSNLNPFTGFVLSDAIASKATTDIEYNVKVNSLNAADLIQNTAKVPFKYQISQGSTAIDVEKDSNTVDTVANYVCMNIVKSVDKSYALIGDILYYTVEVSNSGNIDAIDTVFLDNIQAEASFVAGTVAINGISYSSYDPNQGFTIGTVCSDETVEVTFEGKVNSLPSPNIIYNSSSLVYGYKPDPNGSSLTNTVISNIVQTIINKAQYTITKTVDKVYAQVGDAVVYTTTIKNTGTVALTDVNFSDFLGIYLSLYAGSIYINGVNYPDYGLSDLISIGDIHPGDTATVEFGAKIVKNPPVGYIPNTSEVILSYKQNPSNPVVTKTVRSNEVRTYVPYASIVLVKSVDKSYAKVGDTLTYSFTATNSGNSNSINTLFSDNIQTEASFVTGSVLVNGISKPSYDPQKGFTLGDMATGQVVTVEFKVTVNSLPKPNVISNNATASYSYYVDPSQTPITKTATSNSVTTVINSYSATLTKAVDKAYATIGDVLNYTVTLSNTGTVTITNITFKDLIPAGAAFVKGSVVVDNVSMSDVDPNTGFSITNNVSPGGSSVVMFKATVTSVPVPAQINNNANTTLQYQLSPTSLYVNTKITSNTVTTNINSMSVANTKSVSKSYATVGDTLTYTSVISNKGNVDIENTNFIDSVPNNTSFVSKSVKINGTSYENYDPNTGFTLGTIKAGVSATVTFDVTVNSVPSSGYITNSSIINYQYKIDPLSQYISYSVTSNTATTYINLGNLTITKTADREIVRLTNVITYSFVIANTGNTILKNLVFKDTIQSESSFNINTVYVDGEKKAGYNPNIGFDLSDIPIGSQTTISFTVTANTIPQNNKLLNTGNITYSYYVDPNGSSTTNTKSSNTTTVYVYDTIVSANKSVDKTIAKIKDTLNFTITIKNDGNVLAQHVVFKDILDSNLSFVTGSIYVNDVQKTDVNINPTTGFSLDDIGAGASTIVKFAATIATRPAGNIIYNYATINYDYTIGLQTTNATMNTNTTQTYVAVGELTVSKSVDKAYATVDDKLAYSIIVKNTGSVNSISIKLQDLIPSSTSFVIGSVIIDGETIADDNPSTGITLADLAPNQYHTITFSINVDSLPSNGKVSNTADITFTYQLTSSDAPVTTTTHSNTVTTNIELGKLTATKAVDKAYATIGNTLNYTITINNSGNATCTNVFFRDIVQADASFVDSSVQINGKAYTGYDPNTGFKLDDIVRDGQTIVTFAVTVKTLPKDYNIYNYATEIYEYYVDPTNPPVVVEGKTNTVTTVINVGTLTATKSVSKAYATIDDILTYTISVVNTGNTTAKNVNFRDVIPTGLTFVSGSVTIDGISYSSYNPYGSFTLGNIQAGVTVIVKFNATVTSLPTPSLVSNTANIVFFYKIDPNDSDIPVQVNSNTVATQINLGSLTLTKSVDKAYSTMGYILTYTVVVTNNGNVTASGVVFTDNLQSDITFNTGSVKVNGTTKPEADISVGVNLGDIEPLNYDTIIFTATVIDSPTKDVILNYALSTFSYKIDPNGQDYSKSFQSNTVSTLIIKPSLSSTKVVNKAYATLQEILNYSILIKNGGNTTISSMYFSDFLSNGAIFNSGTVMIDGVSYPQYDPIIGFDLPNDLVSGNTSLVEFQSTITTLPAPPKVTNYGASNGVYYVEPQGTSHSITAQSNTVTTNVNVGSLSNIKSVNKNYAKISDTISYTSTITNTGNVNATSLFFNDALQSELQYIAGTVTINGVVYPSLDPTAGFKLSDLAPNQTITVAFSAKVNSLPTPAYVTNTSNVSFSYNIDPNGTSITKNVASNSVTTYVILGKLTAAKIVDKAIATVGDVLTYTVTLTNVGNVIDSTVNFQDIPSEGVTFKDGSVVVNGTSQPTYNPIIGFSLGDIGIGNVLTVQFQATVTSVPQTNVVTNQSVSTFKYTVDPKQQPYSDTTYSNTVTTNIAYGSLSVTKAVNKQYATIGEEITYTVTIVNIGNINATNVIFKDPIPRNTMFVIGSVTVNGISYSNYNPSAGFDLNTMTSGQIITVVYKVQVLKMC